MDPIMPLCPCGSSLTYAACCEPIHLDHSAAHYPEQLMRARYSAHVLKLVDFVVDTYHPSCLASESKEAITESIHCDWCKLDVTSTQYGKHSDEGYVSFKAYFNDDTQQYCMQEKSRFIRLNNLWYYIDGVVEEDPCQKQSAPKIGRNDPCLCGSGKKYKKCCG
ncbi:hypothetical protein A6E14_07970 [Vibrio genomosp. F10]|uniref:UPF0225 protein A6E14_07970 n=3 Tax=Vibrio genomosp. F10 TaxID=723171 RepID=A0A1B9R025_9VIBR|nr:hypothetical protein A6E14_07970 [Vibrio genomosp. F10]OEE36669.1 hypothetical protein A1QO_18320 [Vibrio genomosp. F10 str. ZF-129]OEE93623.1 hypothetical protein A1QM_08865 [Vibrio genomosp. F10 str. 9ZC157]OEF10483.1 hypothetical protein A1QI_00835 [Vibrio genomosp. F10 str. 9ZB36]